MRLRFAPLAAAAFCLLASASDIDTQKSTLTVRVFKTGLFSAFAHDHQINAPIEHGTFSEEPPAVEFVVAAEKLKALDKESPGNLAKIQKTMLGPEVLDTEKYPEIRFHSTSVERTGEAEWAVHGDLTLHGQTHPVTVKVNKSEGHYRGVVPILQKDWGIEPVSIAGGSVKVKNEVRIEFDVTVASH